LKRFIFGVVTLGVIGLVTAFILSAPTTLSAPLPSHQPDVANGKYMFTAGGCASCHAAPKSKDKTRLPGGLALKTPFGIFYAPNISPDKTSGIGGWTNVQFINALKYGVSPAGSHYYPAFPYTSYRMMKTTDVIDIKAYIDTLPAVKSTVPDHDLALPFRIRRALGLWKFLFMDYAEFKPDPKLSKSLNRGAYLVTGPGHCGECHTPRNIIGGKSTSRAFAGGPAPEGDGKIPNITPHKNGIGGWSVDDILAFLEGGMLPDGDFVGGTMVDVQENIAQLKASDIQAIAEYLKSLPPIP